MYVSKLGKTLFALKLFTNLVWEILKSNKPQKHCCKKKKREPIMEENKGLNALQTKGR